MKPTVLSLIFFVTICLLSGSSGAQQQPAKDQRLPAEKKILIVYLSRTNNTKAIAEIIRQRVGGKDERAEEATREVESWLRKIGILK